MKLTPKLAAYGFAGVGLVLVTTGVALVYPPAALIVCGAVLAYIGFAGVEIDK